MINEEKQVEIGNTSIRLGPAFLRQTNKKKYYELCREIFTVTNNNGNISKLAHDKPIVLALYKIKNLGEKCNIINIKGPPSEMKTLEDGKQIDLILVEWLGKT